MEGQARQYGEIWQATAQPAGGWDDILEEFGVSGTGGMELLHLAEGLAKRWKGSQIVMLVDEILAKGLLRKLGDQSFPESTRMIFILNPRADLYDKSAAIVPSASVVAIAIGIDVAIAISYCTCYHYCHLPCYCYCYCDAYWYC